MLKQNYDNLQSYLTTNVGRVLRDVLKKSYEDIESVKKSEIYEKLEKESKDEITRSKNFNLSLPVLCELLLKGKCESENGNQQLYDDIEFIKNIWTTKIIENEKNVLSADDSEQAKKDLQKVRDRMEKHFGITFLERNQQHKQTGKVNGSVNQHILECYVHVTRKNEC